MTGDKTVYHSFYPHKDTPWFIKGLAVVAALYLISPYDLIPDWIFGPGFIDDIAVVSLILGYGVCLAQKRLAG